MEKADYDFWMSFEELSISQAAYLWCGFEMPPIEYKKNIPVVELPEKVKVILLQLIQAIKFKKIKLNPGQQVEIFFQNPEPFLKNRYNKYFASHLLKLQQNGAQYRSIRPNTVEYFYRVITTRSYLKEYAKSIEQQPKFLFPDTHTKIIQPDDRIDLIIRSVIPGVDKIYEAVKALGFSARDLMPYDDKKALYQKVALEKLSEIKIKYPQIKREFLTPELFDFQDQQQRRDFVGKLLRKILIDQGIKNPGEYSKIYKRSNVLKAGLSGDMSL